MQSIDDIIELMDDLEPEKVDLVRKAYSFAKEKHQGHERMSGEPYFVHLYETARELAELGMGPRTVAAGFLHDCIEDAKVTPEEVEKEFGAEILFLVEGVTKLGTLRYQGAERHAESLRRLFVATSQDIRVLMIKLMDRLHNMRTLEHVRPDKRVRIAKETLEIYAPIADRLGMGRLKKDLEDLAFKFVEPEKYQEMQDLISERGLSRESALEHALSEVKESLITYGIQSFRAEYRIKGLYSLYQKLERKHEIEQIYDILAIRIIVSNVSDCYRVLGLIHSLWRPLPGKIKDYIAFSKPNGYQSIHTTVITRGAGVIEFQIRTEDMHREAQFGIASHLSYKNKGSVVNREQSRQDKVWYQYLIPSLMYRDEKPALMPHKKEDKTPRWVRELGDTYTLTDTSSNMYLEALKSDFFSFRVFVFTPQGDVIDLPIDSSPIDFAYAIHSEIGNHISAAKVNGKLASLDSKLKNGDIVEIVTKKTSHPTRKWLDYAKTSMARKHITSAIQRENGQKT